MPMKKRILSLLWAGLLTLSLTGCWEEEPDDLGGALIPENTTEEPLQEEETEVLLPLSFTLPNALRAAGDARFTMAVSMASMFLFRVCLSYVLGADTLFGVPMLGLHLLGVWIAMFVDWINRVAFFVTRFLRGKWKQIDVIGA